MGAFEYRQAEEIRDTFARHGVRFLFIGKSGAILLGFPDTTQDADLFVEKSPDNGRAIVAALRELGFALDDEQAAQVERVLNAQPIGHAGDFDGYPSGVEPIFLTQAAVPETVEGLGNEPQGRSIQ